MAGLFGGVDDAFGDAVLGRSTGVEVFDFDGDGGFDAGRLRDVVELDERGVADEFCEAVVDGHVKSFVAGVVGVLLRCVREPTFPDEWTVALV